MDIATIKQRQQAAWASGDYAAVGSRLLLTAELLCEAVDLRAGERVLDVACGNGNAALAAARRFCQVTGVDYVPELLERARERVQAEGLEATFQEADAEDLPFPDNSFDVVLSTCGAMFAPDQERTAAELLRVCRPGGRIGMVNWVPDGYVGELFRTIGRYLPPPLGLRPPVQWGSEERLRKLFGPEVTIEAPAGPSAGGSRRPSTRRSSSPPSTAPPTRRWRRCPRTAPPTSRPTWSRWPAASTSPTTTP
jgi:SAM-dependent methyltransferase